MTILYCYNNQLTNLDSSKASNWTGATYDSTTNTLKINSISTEITVDDVNAMTKAELIEFIEDIDSSDNAVLTAAQLRAIERILEIDYA